MLDAIQKQMLANGGYIDSSPDRSGKSTEYPLGTPMDATIKSEMLGNGGYTERLPDIQIARTNYRSLATEYLQKLPPRSAKRPYEEMVHLLPSTPSLSTASYKPQERTELVSRSTSLSGDLGRLATSLYQGTSSRTSLPVELYSGTTPISY